MPKVNNFVESEDTPPDAECEDTEDDEFDEDGLVGLVDGDNDEDDDITLADLMQTFFASEEGKNIVDTLQGIKKALDTNNKILAKLATSLETHVSKQ